jgi:RNA polymerase sigma factor (sigma-70 family)
MMTTLVQEYNWRRPRSRFEIPAAEAVVLGSDRRHYSLRVQLPVSISDHLAARVPRVFELNANGDALAIEDGFEQFYSCAFPRVYSFIRSQVGNVHTAQDIVGRIFLKAYKHRNSIPAGPAAMVWVFRIAHTTLIDHWRVEGRRHSTSVSIDDLADFPGELPNPEAAYAQKERKALLLSVMSELDKDDCTVLGLKFTAQQTNREIAAILDLSEGAVSMRLLRALRRLRERLLERGINS